MPWVSTGAVGRPVGKGNISTGLEAEVEAGEESKGGGIDGGLGDSDDGHISGADLGGRTMVMERWEREKCGNGSKGIGEVLRWVCQELAIKEVWIKEISAHRRSPCKR
ncbi:hypothetical protein H6P81_006077 [Aristolochia fimbriata]|uniref:Uncharacterized protein n=1 Tax=Aristolochia fimbriata TaxID=158543 RepID=A0AAV7EWH8_ARIFI|nr:hypothetical protein H6P81_006077 [Aristolochia fimbriata]